MGKAGTKWAKCLIFWRIVVTGAAHKNLSRYPISMTSDSGGNVIACQ